MITFLQQMCCTKNIKDAFDSLKRTASLAMKNPSLTIEITSCNQENIFFHRKHQYKQKNLHIQIKMRNFQLYWNFQVCFHIPIVLSFLSLVGLTFIHQD